MANKLGFYLHQGIKYLGQSKLTILALGLAVSMIAGFGYYYDSAQNFTLQESYLNSIDFGIDFEETSEFNLNSILNDESYEVQRLFYESKLQIENSFYVRSVISEHIDLLHINSQNVTTEKVPHWIFSNSSTFQSLRFLEYYNIIEGTFPKNPDEFLVSEDFALNQNISIGINQTINVQIGKISKKEKNISCNIVGIYSPLHLNGDFGNFDHIANKEIIFGYIDFSEPKLNISLSNLIVLLEENSEVHSLSNLGLTVKSSLNFIFKRKSVKVAWLSLSSQQIKDELDKINFYLPGNFLIFNAISPILDAQFNFQTDLRLKIQITNIPLFLFAIYLGSIATKSKMKRRYNEFFSMRMRGFKKSMIRTQFIFEALINSTLISTLGLIFGLGIFKFGQYWLNPISIPQFNVSGFSIPFHFTFETIIETFVFSAILTILSTIASIRHVNSLKTSDLIAELSNFGEDLAYDETTLFTEKNKKKEESENELGVLNIKDFIKKMEDEIPKWGIPVSLLALIPVVLYVLILIGQSFTLPDVFLEISTGLQNQYGLLIILAFISPFVLVVGLLHYLLVESQLRLANIAKKISRIFVKARDYFVGLEMVRQKQHTRVIFISSIFIALMIFSNMTVNTMVRQNKILRNFEVGADLQISFQMYGTIFDDRSDLDDYEQQLQQIKDSEDNLLILCVLKRLLAQ